MGVSISNEGDTGVLKVNAREAGGDWVYFTKSYTDKQIQIVEVPDSNIILGRGLKGYLNSVEIMNHDGTDLMEQDDMICN